MLVDALVPLGFVGLSMGLAAGAFLSPMYWIAMCTHTASIVASSAFRRTEDAEYALRQHGVATLTGSIALLSWTATAAFSPKPHVIAAVAITFAYVALLSYVPKPEIEEPPEEEKITTSA